MADPAAGTLDNPFWKFSLSVYGVPGVADECLAVQESHAVDVNILLFCAWLALARQVALTRAGIDAIVVEVGTWHESAVKPLRVARRYMKKVAGPDVAALRTLVKAAELEAEQLEQAMLFAYAEKHWRDRGQGALPETLSTNLEGYLRAQGYAGPGGDALPLQSLSAAVLNFPTVS